MSTAAPESGRAGTLLDALRRLPAGALILEVGATRSTKHAACLSDGWSTRVFSWWARENGGRVVSVDPAEKARRATLEVCAAYVDDVLTFILADARRVVGDHSPDLIYMDGPPDPAFHLEVWEALREPLPRWVLFDDILDCADGAVKGSALWSVLPAAGYRLAFCRDRQALFERSMNEKGESPS